MEEIRQSKEEMRKVREELSTLKSERSGETSGGVPGGGKGGSNGSDNLVKVISGIRAEPLKSHRFEGVDYDLWSFVMKRNLKVAKLWDVVEGGYEPDGEVDVEEGSGPTTDWLARNTEAEHLILQSVAKSQLPTLTGCLSAKEMWDKLASNYAEKSRANKMKAERDFLNCTMRRGQSMEDYIRTFDNLCNRLRSLGHVLEEETKVNRLLEGLSADYEVIRITLQDRDDLTYDQASSRLLANARMRPRLNFGMRPRANATEGGPRDEGRDPEASAAAGQLKKKNKGVCYICGDGNHYSNKCPHNTGDKTRRVCHKCKKEGHLKKDCPKKSEDKEKGASADATETRPWNAVATVLLGQAAQTANLKGRFRGSWIIDSGATHHMSNDLRWFTCVEDPDVSKHVSLADASTVEVKKEGTVQLQIPEEKWTTVLELGEVLYTPEFGKNLFSVSHALKEGIDVRFSAKEKTCYLTHAGVHVAKAVLRDNLWVLDGACFMEPGQEEEEEGALTAASASIGGSIRLWHHRLGHLGEENLLRLAGHGMVRGIP